MGVSWLVSLWRYAGVWFLTFGLVVAQAQEVSWERIGTIGAGQLLSWSTLVVSPLDAQVMFVTTNDGLYRSDNSGRDWQLLPLPFIGFAFAPSPQNSQALYVASGREVYHSPDNGQHWEKLLETEWWIQALAVHPRVSTLIYAAGGASPGVMGLDPGQAMCYRSTDGGQTWQKALLPDNIPVRWLVPHPLDEDVVYAVTEYEWKGFISGNVFRSDDQGITWQQIARGRRVPLLIHPEQPDRMAAIFAEQSRFDRIWFEFSLDGGHTWARGMGMQERVVTHITLGTKPDTLYAIASDGIYYSLNDGFTWRLVSNQFNSQTIVALVVSTDLWMMDGYPARGLLLLTNFGGVYRLRVTEPPHSVTPQGKSMWRWGAIKRDVP